jgi:hypothetical protein
MVTLNSIKPIIDSKKYMIFFVYKLPKLLAVTAKF